MPIVGEVLADRYRLDAPLGAGGMATVWRAHDLRLDRDVAVKLLAANLAGDPVVAERFEREARALAASSHPNVVAIYDVERGDRRSGREPFYVMELCDGGSLSDRFVAAPDHRVPPVELVPIVSAIADGLASLHDRGIVHRDVKPHNILLCGGRPKLADFGLARPEAPSELIELTATGMTVGTLAYLAPEVIDGAPATSASDVFGLAVVTYQGLVGRLPRPSGSVAEVVASRDAAVPAASRVAPALGGGFDEVLAQGLARDPASRPSARKFAQGLEAAARAGVLARSTFVSDDSPTQPLPIAPAESQTPLGRQAARPNERSWADDRHRDRTSAGVRGLVGAALLIALAIVVLSAMANALGDRPGGLAGASSAPPSQATPPPSPSASEPTSPSPSPTASPTPTPATPSPTPAPDPLEAVRSARDGLIGAVMQAEQAGLGQGEANRIVRFAEEALRALEQDDPDRARERVAELLDKIDGLDDEVDDEAAEDLSTAAETFAAAVEDAIGG